MLYDLIYHYVYSPQIYYWCPKMRNDLFIHMAHYRNILEFSVLFSVMLLIFQLCNSKSCRTYRETYHFAFRARKGHYTIIILHCRGTINSIFVDCILSCADIYLVFYFFKLLELQFLC